MIKMIIAFMVGFTVPLELILPVSIAIGAIALAWRMK